MLKLPAPLQLHSSDLSCNDGWTPISLNVVFYHSIVVLESLAWFPETPQCNRERFYTTSHCVSVHLHTIHRPWASNSNHTKQRQERYTQTHANSKYFQTGERQIQCMMCLQQCSVHFSTNVSKHFQTEWEIYWRGIRTTGSELHAFAVERVLFFCSDRCKNQL